MKILLTARYVDGKPEQGGSGRFMKTVADTLEQMGHFVEATDYPNHKDIYDLIICSHPEQWEMIKGNEARKVFISHGIIQDEFMRIGANKYIAISEEVQKYNWKRGFESTVVPQPITVRERKKPSDKLDKILIIRAYTVDNDPFSFLSENYDVRISTFDEPIEDQIDWADLCITLGRGALESMAQGKPVLIADNRPYIGAYGDGYVNKHNIKAIAKNNFSGRALKIPITREWIEDELKKYNPEDSIFLHNYIKENHDAVKVCEQYLKTTQVHIVTAFYRKHLIDTIIHHYEPMGIIWHPVMFESEACEFPNEKQWIQPVVIPDNNEKTGFIDAGYYKNNWFIHNHQINDEDYYIMLDDDDMIEPQAVRRVRELDEEVVFISLKRGYRTPENATLERQYGVSSLIADENNVRVSGISKQQIVVKGHVLRRCNLMETVHEADGILAIWLKENYPIRYERDFYALFNYFEPGRWDKPPVAFGALINDVYRMNSVLKKSALPNGFKVVMNPESATKGINTLLGIMENEGAKIGIIAHQDMYFRNGWLESVMKQIDGLPDSWIVAGVVGKDVDGRICGNIHDMRMVDHINTRDIHEFPQPAAAFDECVLIFNLSKQFRFDESLDGFDLYGTLAVLQTWEMGGTAWVLDAFCEHYCMRPFTWFPDEEFGKRYKRLFDRYHEKFGCVDSTAFVNKPKKNAIRRFETSAA